MTFVAFKKAIKKIPIAENDYRVEEIKLKWKKIKMELQETKDKRKIAYLETLKKTIKEKVK